jgi:hypothetical protein
MFEPPVLQLSASAASASGSASAAASASASGSAGSARGGSSHGSSASGGRSLQSEQRELHRIIETRLLDEELTDRVEDLIKFVMPTSASEQRYSDALAFIENIIKKAIGAEVYAHGSYALKTYLPDADLDVSAFFSKALNTSWVQRVVNALCQEANVAATDPRFAVRSVTFVNADTRVVKCQIGRISIDISGNQVGALATLGLFEEIDRLVGRDHLFKRTVLLVKTWAENEARIVGSHHGYLSSYCLRTLVLYIFNAYHTRIQTVRELPCALCPLRLSTLLPLCVSLAAAARVVLPAELPRALQLGRARAGPLWAHQAQRECRLPVRVSTADLTLLLVAGSSQVRGCGQGSLCVAAGRRASGHAAAVPGLQHLCAQPQALANRHVSSALCLLHSLVRSAAVCLLRVAMATCACCTASTSM